MLRSRSLGFGVCFALVALSAVAGCSSSPEGTFFANDSGATGSSSDAGGGGPDGTVGPTGPTPVITTEGGAPDVAPTDGGVVVTNTIYANTDDSLYSVDPQTKAVTLVGPFVFTDGTDASANAVTDVAVNAAGMVYVNTESAVYSAALPATAPGNVVLTLATSIAVGSGQRFYALAFAPAGALGATEMLVGGDGSGALYSIDVANGGAIKNLGSFGNDPSIAGNILALSGDVVFYLDATGAPTGLATIRSCAPAVGTKAPKCDANNDFLAGVDMTALGTAFTSGAPAKSLNAGIYGGSATLTGNGIGFGEVFGLGAWEGNVYGFTRHRTADAGVVNPTLISIDATTNGGSGSALPGSFSFTNGWSGAGVTTKVKITVGPPPPPPPPPK